MWEVLCTTSDELGIRTGPTGSGSIYRSGALKLAKELRKKHGDETTRFFVEWVPSEDEWNAWD